jgi:hypothetical protein
VHKVHGELICLELLVSKHTGYSGTKLLRV